MSAQGMMVDLSLDTQGITFVTSKFAFVSFLCAFKQIQTMFRRLNKQ